MASSMQAALHMDPSYEKNLELFKTSEFESEGNSEIKNVFPADVARVHFGKNPYCLK